MYLGLDLGTSGVKALLIDARQAIVGVSQWRARRVAAASRLVGAGPGALDPGDRRSGRRAQALASGSELAAVRGIGLSGQMHGATLLDDSDKVLRPCILWNDTRSHAEAAAARRRSALPRDHRQHRLSRLHRAEAALGEEPRARRSSSRSRKVLLPKDYLRLWLTGEHISEMSDSAGTSWLDVGATRWSPELLAATVLDEQQMPALVEGTEPAGTLRAELAGAWGMGAGVVGRRRRRRQRRFGLRHGHGQARRGLRVARHVGRAVRRQRQPICPTRKAPCTPSAMRCPMPGTRWASSCRRPIRSTGCRASTGKSAERSDRRARRHAQGAGRASPSCPISPASARRTMTRRSAAPSPGLATNRIAPR